MDDEPWRELRATRFAELPWDCGQSAAPGVVDADEWRDWSQFETTPDQLRIESYLDRFSLRGKRILHIGVGNSGLARRFHRRAAAIDGTTVVGAELSRADSLGLPNYEVVLHNKHRGRDEAPDGPFDFIVDNNPTTFCCCFKHLAVMIDWYAGSLAAGGQIVTDRVGLGWVTDAGPANPRWSFTFDDLVAMAPLAGLSAYRMNADIYVLSRERPARAGPVALAQHLMRRARGATQPSVTIQSISAPCPE